MPRLWWFWHTKIWRENLSRLQWQRIYRGDPMKTRSLNTRIWQDGWFETLSTSEKLLFIYLLTNQYVNLPGIYELSDRRILLETGLDNEQLQSAKKSLENKIMFFDGWIIIKNIERYDTYSGGKLLIAREKQLQEIPEAILDKSEAFKGKISDRVSIEYPYPMDTRNSNSNSNRGIVKGDEDDTSEDNPNAQRRKAREERKANKNSWKKSKPISFKQQEETKPNPKRDFTPLDKYQLWEIAKEMRVPPFEPGIQQKLILDMLEDGSLPEKYGNTMKFVIKKFLRFAKEKGQVEDLDELGMLALEADHPDKIEERLRIAEEMRGHPGESLAIQWAKKRRLHD